MAEETHFPQNWLIGQEYDPTNHVMKFMGRDYLNVQNRLIWFIRDQRALMAAGLATTTYIVHTELIELDRTQGWAHFKTHVRDVLGNEATMYGSEALKDFGDYIEKASTKSLGRALLLLGYGTAFADELDEGDRVVDAPVETKAKPTMVPAGTVSMALHKESTAGTAAKSPPATRKVLESQGRQAMNANLLKIQEWCVERGISGAALNVYRARHQLNASVERHVERLWREMESDGADIVGELSCIELACKHLTNLQIISDIMKQQGIASYAAFWREYQKQPEDWHAFIDDWLATKAAAANA